MLSVQSAILGQVSREASRSTLINNLQGVTGYPGFLGSVSNWSRILLPELMSQNSHAQTTADITGCMRYRFG